MFSMRCQQGVYVHVRRYLAGLFQKEIRSDLQHEWLTVQRQCCELPWQVSAQGLQDREPASKA